MSWFLFSVSLCRPDGLIIYGQTFPGTYVPGYSVSS